MADSGKTEKATQKKREDERKKGNIFQSKDVINSLSLLAIIFIFKLGISPIFLHIQKNIVSSLSSLAGTTELTIESAAAIFTDVTIKALMVIFPIGIIIALIAVVISGMQTRFLFVTSRLKPKFSRLNPASGMKRVFSLRSVVELIKSLIKVTIIASVLYTKIKSNFSLILRTPFLELNEAIKWLGDTVYDITLTIALYMAFFAAADYFYQWWEYEKEIRMTKQEVKDEFKQTEGDPQIKGRIKEVQRKMAAMRMMKKVPEADVVIKNPTHYAVALKYKPHKDKAPVVIAKGKDYVALRIIDIAEKNGVEVTENRPLARGLYEAVEIDRPIPEEFYRPVAEVLAFIYKLKEKRKK